MNLRWIPLVAAMLAGVASVPACSTSSDTETPVTDGGTTDGGACATGQSKCGSVCVDTSDDRNNCGTCGNACGAGLVCVAGKCSVACPASQKDCSGVCATLETDRDNCGACGTKCGAGEVCSAGKCQVSCGAGLAECGSGDARTCANTSSDRENCGTCGNACAAGQLCVGGKCEATCGADLTDCSGTCRDTKNDPTNCGTCGNACPSGQVCSAGTCSSSCPTGLTECGGVCKDLQNDNSNCGVCSSACATGEVCAAGTCSVSCPGGLRQCGGVCRDVRFDKSHCGACGNACGTGQLCVDGVCTTSCGTLTLCTGVCKDTRVDVSNCGTCGNACATGQVCNAGTCTTTCGSFTKCGDVCKDTQVDSLNCGTCGNTCGDGTKCVAGVCTVTCPTGLTKCGVACVNVNIDGSNCGACGNPCAAGQSCSGGSCVTADSGGGCGTLTDCGGGACKDTQVDPSNCGSCGNACTGGKACSAGTCDCPLGRMSCGGSCIDPSSNSLNCGGCGVACGSNQVCAGGSCVAVVSGNGGPGGPLNVASPPKVAVCYGGTTADLQTRLQGLGIFSAVDLLNINTTAGVPNLDKLKQYDAVTVGTYLSVSGGAAFGDALAAYLEAGGGVVLFDYESQETGTYALTGRFQTEYTLTTPVSSSTFAGGPFALGTIAVPSHPILNGVVTAACGGTGCKRLPASALKPGANVVASWNDGTPAVITGTLKGRRVVELNMFTHSSVGNSTMGWDPASDALQLVANALKWSIPQLSVKVEKTVDGGSVAVSSKAVKTVTYTNESTVPQTITALTLSGSHVADFKLPTLTLPATVAPGESLVVSLTFSPSDTGLRAATLTATVSGAPTTATTLLTVTGS